MGSFSIYPVRRMKLMGSMGLLLWISFSFHCSNNDPIDRSNMVIKPISILATEQSWQPEIDYQTELVLVRFLDDTSQFYRTVDSWKDNDYRIGIIVSTTFAKERGHYANFLLQKEQMQLSDVYQRDGNNKGVQTNRFGWYIIPDSIRITYFKYLLKDWIDHGIETIAFEEPVYLASTGYHQRFKDHWRISTKSEWIDPADSVDCWFQSGMLKQDMLVNLIQQITQFGKTYAEEQGKSITFFLVNSSGIASAAQHVITPGTKRYKSPNIDGFIGSYDSATYPSFNYQDHQQSRAFVSAYLDYSLFSNSMNPNQQPMILSLDSYYNSGDYTTFWRLYATSFIALLLHPPSARYHYLTIPEQFLNHNEFATSDQIGYVNRHLGTVAFILETLHRFPEEQTYWRNQFPRTGVVFSDTYMFQRSGPTSSDMESFYQLAMPFIQHGVPIEVIPWFRLEDPSFLEQFEVLYMSYEGYKPANSKAHFHLNRWISRQGGILFFYIGITDLFDEINQWWSETYDRPHEHLFELLGTGMYPSSNFHKVDRGIVFTEHSSPSELAKKKKSGEIIWNTYVNVIDNYTSFHTSIDSIANRYLFHRGPYEIIYIPDELSNPKTYHTQGNYIDLFSQNLPLVKEKMVKPGEVSLLLNLDYFPEDTMAVVLSSSRISTIQREQSGFTFISNWIKQTPIIHYIHVTNRPITVVCVDSSGREVDFQQQWIAEQKLLRIQVESMDEPLQFTISVR